MCVVYVCPVCVLVFLLVKFLLLLASRTPSFSSSHVCVVRVDRTRTCFVVYGAPVISYQHARTEIEATRRGPRSLITEMSLSMPRDGVVFEFRKTCCSRARRAYFALVVVMNGSCVYVCTCVGLRVRVCVCGAASRDLFVCV